MKIKTLGENPIPFRMDAATLENISTIISSGLASDRAQAIRVCVAIVARLLTDDARLTYALEHIELIPKNS